MTKWDIYKIFPRKRSFLYLSFMQKYTVYFSFSEYIHYFFVIYIECGFYDIIFDKNPIITGFFGGLASFFFEIPVKKRYYILVTFGILLKCQKNNDNNSFAELSGLLE